MRCHAPPEATRRPVEAEDRLVKPHHPASLRCAGAPRKCPQQAFGKPEQPEALCHHEATRHGGAERDRPRRPVDRDDPMRSPPQHEEPNHREPGQRGHLGGQVDGDARGRGKGANAAPDQQLSPDELAADLCHRQQGIHRVADPAHPEQEGPSWPDRSEDQRCPPRAEKRICGRRRARTASIPQDAPARRRRISAGSFANTKEATTASPTSRLTRVVLLTRPSAAYASASPGRPGRF